jgi:hypothetical protein
MGSVVRAFIVAVVLPGVLSGGRAEGAEVQIGRVTTQPRVDLFAGMDPEDPRRHGFVLIEGLVQRLPVDGASVSERTVVYLGYDDRQLYALYFCFDREPSRVRARLTSRDRIPEDDDSVALQLDTFNDRRRAYSFQANAAGVQLDSIWTEGQSWDRSFDTIWQAEGRITERGYVVLISVPFKSLRFPPGDLQQWGFFVYRAIPRVNEDSYFPAYSSRVQGRLNQAGHLLGLRGISQGRNAEVLPYATYGAGRLLDSLPDRRFTSDLADAAAGVDLKLVLRDSMVVDVTANPDFSQIESDEPQVTANQRFEVSFPERRPFFIENASYFETPMRLLFTRRIIDPRAGARFSGKVKKWAIGSLITDDAGQPADDGESPPTTRLAFVRASRDLGRQSNVGVFVGGRDTTGRRNAFASLDGRVAIGRNWLSTAQVAHSTTRDSAREPRKRGYGMDLSLMHAGTHLSYRADYRDRSPEFEIDSGFIPRTNMREMLQTANYRFRRTGRLLAWGPDASLGTVWDHDGLRLDDVAALGIALELRGPTRLSVTENVKRERLVPADTPSLPEMRDYSQRWTSFTFSSSSAKTVALTADGRIGTTINFVPPPGVPPSVGAIRAATLNLTIRPQQAMSLQSAYLWTHVGVRGSGAEIFDDHIARLRVGYQFTRKFSLRAIVQYNTRTVDPQLSGLRPVRAVNGDVLLTYLAQPGRAIYVGFNTNLREFEQPDSAGSPIFHSRSEFLNDSRRAFAKVSYLVRF